MEVFALCRVTKDRDNFYNVYPWPLALRRRSDWSIIMYYYVTKIDNYMGGRMDLRILQSLVCEAAVDDLQHCTRN